MSLLRHFSFSERAVSDILSSLLRINLKFCQIEKLRSSFVSVWMSFDHNPSCIFANTNHDRLHQTLNASAAKIYTKFASC